MKNFCLSILCGLCMAGLIFSAGCKKDENSSNPTREPQSSQNQPVTIGALLPLTGDAASYGEDAKEGIDLAVQTANSEGIIPGAKLDVVYADDEMNPAKAVSAFQNLIARYNLPAVVGGIGSGVALAVMPIANEHKIVFFSPTASSPKLSDAGPYFFRNYPADNFEGGQMAKYMRELGKQRIAVIYINNEYGVGIEAEFRKAFERDGGKIVLSDAYNQGTTTFTEMLEKMRQANPDAVYLPGYYQGVGRILKQKVELGIDVPAFGVAPLEDPKLLEIAGNAAEGFIYTRPAFNPKNPTPEYATFQKAFVEKFKREPGIAATQSYDAVLLIAHALAKGPHTGESLRDSLIHWGAFTGASGTMTLLPNGDVQRDFTLFVVKGGLFQPYNPNSK